MSGNKQHNKIYSFMDDPFLFLGRLTAALFPVTCLAGIVYFLSFLHEYDIHLAINDLDWQMIFGLVGILGLLTASFVTCFIILPVMVLKSILPEKWVKDPFALALILAYSLFFPMTTGALFLDINKIVGIVSAIILGPVIFILAGYVTLDAKGGIMCENTLSLFKASAKTIFSLTLLAGSIIPSFFSSAIFFQLAKLIFWEDGIPAYLLVGIYFLVMLACFFFLSSPRTGFLVVAFIVLLSFLNTQAKFQLGRASLRLLNVGGGIPYCFRLWADENLKRLYPELKDDGTDYRGRLILKTSDMVFIDYAGLVLRIPKKAVLECTGRK